MPRTNGDHEGSSRSVPSALPKRSRGKRRKPRDAGRPARPALVQKRGASAATDPPGGTRDAIEAFRREASFVVIVDSLDRLHRNAADVRQVFTALERRGDERDGRNASRRTEP